MNTSTIAYASRGAALLSRAGYFLELTKPKIAVLELVTVVVGATIASSGVPGDIICLLNAVVGTLCVAGSASALNQLLERDSDGQMNRTADRPLPSGHLSPREVVVFGIVLFVFGTFYLGLLVNWLTASIGALTWLIYVGIYTPMKSRSTLNTFVGAIASTGPVLMGWTAVQPEFATREDVMLATTLFLIVFLWQFPHFMAIAWLYRRQYADAGAKMLTVIDATGRLAGRQAVLTAALLIPVSLYPAVIMRAGPAYLVLALILSVVQLVVSARFMFRPSEQSARRLLRMSLVYLPALFGLLMTTPFIFPWL